MAFCSGLIHLQLQLVEPLVDIVDVAQLALQFVVHGNQFANSLCMIFLFKTVYLVETVVDRVEVGRIEVHLLQLSAYLLCNVLEFDICRLHARGEFAGNGQYLAHLIECRACRAE